MQHLHVCTHRQSSSNHACHSCLPNASLTCHVSSSTCSKLPVHELCMHLQSTGYRTTRSGVTHGVGSWLSRTHANEQGRSTLRPTATGFPCPSSQHRILTCASLLTPPRDFPYSSGTDGALDLASTHFLCQCSRLVYEDAAVIQDVVTARSACWAHAWPPALPEISPK